MKRQFIIFLLLLLLSHNIYAQVYVNDTSKSSLIRVTTVVGKYKATNRVKTGTLNIKTGHVFCQTDVKDFDFGPVRVFQASTTVGRFLSAYMEVDKYPHITFEGQILKLNEIDFSRNGIYTAQVKGRLTARGISKPMTVPIIIEVKDNELSIQSDFMLNPADDYKLRADTPAKYSYFKAVDINVYAILKQQL